MGCKVRRGEGSKRGSVWRHSGSSPLSSLPGLGCRGGSLSTSLFPRGVPPACCSGPADICSQHGVSSLPPQRPESPPHTHPRMPPCADVAVPGSCLRGERQARLMCDETESSEPLRGSGSTGGRGLRMGTRKDRSWGEGRYREEGMLGYVSLQYQSGAGHSTGFGMSLHMRSETSRGG